MDGDRESHDITANSPRRAFEKGKKILTETKTDIGEINTITVLDLKDKILLEESV